MDLQAWTEIEVEPRQRHHALLQCASRNLAVAAFFWVVYLEAVKRLRAPVKNDKVPAGFSMEWLEYLEPHSLVRFLWKDAGLSIDEDLVREYWREYRARGHAWAVESRASDDFIPLGLYGDGCRVRHVAHQPVQKCVGIFLNCPLFRPYGSRASGEPVAALLDGRESAVGLSHT